uniref:Alpha A protein n=1 Tax=Lychnis ringspot virus TaxID=44421 RepID=A0A2D1PXF5_9VIRU|nr:alpha A protein [Lychnis ringspot virus]
MASDEIVRNLISREEVMGNLISTASASVRSPLHDVLCTHVGTVINSVEKKCAGRRQIDVRRNLTSDELQTLIKDYPEYSIVSSACESGTHSMAACYRFLETEYLLDFVPKRETMIWDIGGNWFSHMKFRSDLNIHCCCPILSLRDSERFETRCMNMQRFMRGDREKSLQLFTKYLSILKEQERRKLCFARNDVTPQQLDGEVFCENTFQECVRVAPEGHLATAIAVHSCYDISVESLVSSCKRKGITQMYGCMLFPPSILIGQKEGDLPFVKGKFKIEKGKISFFFLNDPNAGYTHDLSDYLKYFEKTYIDVPEGIFSIELLQMRGDTMFFKITDVTAAAYHLKYRGIKFDDIFKCVPMNAQTSVVVPVFSWDNSGLSVSSALLPRNIVEQGASYAMKNKEKDLTVSVLKNYLSSVNNSYIFNGSQVRQGEKVNPSLLSQLAVTIFLREKVYRVRETKIVDHFEHLFKEDVSLKELFGGVVWGKNVKMVCDFYRKVKMDLARWFGLSVDPHAFDICDPPLYQEIKDRWEVNVRGEIPLSSFFNCEEEVEACEARIVERKLLAESIVNKAIGVTNAAETSPIDVNRLKTLSNVSRLFLAASAVNAWKNRAGCDNSSDASSISAEGFMSASKTLTSSPSCKLTDPVDQCVPMWEIAHNEVLNFQKINGDMLKRTSVPAHPVPQESYYANARAEFLYYLLSSVISERAQMMEIISHFRAGQLYTDKVVAPLSSYIYSCEKMSWMLRTPKPTEVGHDFAVHFKFRGVSEEIEECLEYCTITEVRWDRSGGFISNVPILPVRDGFYLFCDATKLCNNYLIYNNLVDVYYENTERPVKFSLIEGVPGCGKSTAILNAASSRKHAVIGEGRKAIDDLRERFIKEKKWSAANARKRVRTLDSVLLATQPENVPTCEGFHFDEALKVHFGAILLCADKVRAKYVIGQGDRAQLPMINRVEGVDLAFSAPDYSCVEITPKLMSYRIPGDVAYFLSKKCFYKNRGVPQIVTTKNIVERSMFARGQNTPDRFVSLQDLPIIPGAQYLTFLQSEKEALISHLKSKSLKDFSVNTIHESQGGTFANVVLVRLQRTENEIYPGGLRSSSYVVVGTTRHTKSFIYCSVVDDRLLLDIADTNGLKDVPVSIFREHIVN